MRVLTAIAATVLLGVVRVTPAAAQIQIDPADALEGGLNAAAEAGVAVLALFVLLIVALVGVIGAWLWYRDRQATRQEQKDERDERREDRKTLLELFVASEKRSEEMAQFNAALMKQLDATTKAGAQVGENVGKLTTAAQGLLDSTKVAEEARSERYKTLDKRQADTEAATSRVAAELHDMKTSIDALTRQINEKAFVTPADRALLETLTRKVDTLLGQLERNDDEPRTALPPVDRDREPAVGPADSGTGNGVSDEHGDAG